MSDQPIIQPPLPPAVMHNSPNPISPLNEEHFKQIHLAVATRRTINSAAKKARIDAIFILIIGISSIPFVLFWPGWINVFVVTGICTVGVFEWMGYKMMRQAQPAAARWLGYNQLVLLGIIMLYCIIQMVTFSPEEIKSQVVSPEIQSQLGELQGLGDFTKDVGKLASFVTYGFCGAVIMLSMGFQGSLAIYYFTRRKYIEAFNSQTPEWIRRLFFELAV